MALIERIVEREDELRVHLNLGVDILLATLEGLGHTKHIYYYYSIKQSTTIILTV